jgi:hypothetical protein
MAKRRAFYMGLKMPLEIDLSCAYGSSENGIG